MVVAKGLEVTGDMAAAAEQIKALYKLFVEADCTMVEVRKEPLEHIACPRAFS